MLFTLTANALLLLLKVVGVIVAIIASLFFSGWLVNKRKIKKQLHALDSDLDLPHKMVLIRWMVMNESQEVRFGPKISSYENQRWLMAIDKLVSANVIARDSKGLISTNTWYECTIAVAYDIWHAAPKYINSHPTPVDKQVFKALIRELEVLRDY